MLYQIINGTVSMGGECILEHFDFEIKGKEKIAIVGRNGCGKTDHQYHEQYYPEGSNAKRSVLGESRETTVFRIDWLYPL